MIKVYGPYLRKDGRKHVIHYDTDTGKRRTQSYPRYLMEQHLGRELLPDETVDHINEDFTDDRIENLQLLSLADNIRLASKGPIMLRFVCPCCKKPFSIRQSQYKHNQKKMGKRGPFCSRRCAGKTYN